MSNPSDPFSVCRFIAIIALWIATMSSAICTVAAISVGVWVGAFWYGIGTIVLGSVLRLMIWTWFRIS